jgi:hypothetical protein
MRPLKLERRASVNLLLHRFSVNLGNMARGLSLNNIPPRLWKFRIREFDQLVTEKRVTQFAGRVLETMARRASDQRGRMLERLAADTSRPGGAAAARDRCAGLTESVHQQ